MAYQQNNNAPPAVIKQDITNWIPVIQEMTENHWKDNEVRLIWNNQPNAMSPDDFIRMMYIAAKRGLDPLLRQIYATCRFSRREQKYSTTIEATIDGFRLASDRTGEVEGMSEPRFAYITNPEGAQVLHSCTLTLYRRGCPQGFTATVFLSEFCQTDFNGNATDMWRKMPHQMLSKCCEAIVRRMAFPAALSGIYAKEEMMQADNEAPLGGSYAPQNQPLLPAPVVIAQPQPPAPATPITQPTVADPNEYLPEAPKPGRKRKQDTPAPVPAPPVETVQTTVMPPRMMQAPVPPPPSEQPPDKFICADTGQPIVDWTDPGSNQAYTRDWIYEYSIRTLGRPLCADRLLAVKQESAKPPASHLENKAAQILNGTAA